MLYRVNQIVRRLISGVVLVVFGVTTLATVNPAAASASPAAGVRSVAQTASQAAASGAPIPATAPLLPFALPNTSVADQDGATTISSAGQLVLQATGPCDPMIEVDALAKSGWNQWDQPHAYNKYIAYGGAPWHSPGWGCGAKAYLGGAAGDTFALRTMNNIPSAWNIACTSLPAPNPVTGVECLGSGSDGVPAYGVPSPTLQVPVSCLFNYSPPPNYLDPSAGSHQVLPSTGKAADDLDADNSSPGLEGNILNCSVQAQEYVPGHLGIGGSWQPAGPALQLTSAVPVCKSTGTCNVSVVHPTENLLTVALSQVQTELRLVYSASVGQDGNIDGSGVNDNPIGTTYCQDAIIYGIGSNLLGKGYPKNYYACNSSSRNYTVGIASGTTPPAMFAVEPTGLAQLAVMPYKIFYQPPGDLSTAKFTVAKSTDISTAVSLAKSAANSQGVNTSVTLGGSASGGIGAFFSANITYSHTWETDVASTNTQASATTGASDISDQNAQTWTSNSSCAGCGNSALKDPHNPPWMYDELALLVHPQFALWDLATCSSGVPSVPAGSKTPGCPAGSSQQGTTGSEPIADGSKGELFIPVGELVALAQGGQSFTLPQGSATVKLTPSDMWSLIALDPFAATALGLEAPPAGSDPGQSVDPGPIWATPGSTPPTAYAPESLSPLAAAGSNGTQTLDLKSTDVQTHTTDTTSTYKAQVTDISDNSVAVGTNLNVPIGIFSIGGGASVSYDHKTTTGLDTQLTYDTTDTLAGTIVNDTSVTFGDDANGIQASVWLDPRWGTFAYQVLRPQVSTISPSHGWPLAATALTVTGKGFWAGPADVLFCPVDGGTCGQGTVVAGLATSPNTDTQMRVIPPAMPAGTVADVRVLDTGGESVPVLADRFTFGDPGTAHVQSVTPPAAPPGTVERIVASGFKSGEQVAVSYPVNSQVAGATANSKGVIDATFVLPDIPQGSATVEVSGQSSGRLGTSTLTVVPSLTLHPGAGAAGQSVVATMFGLAANHAAVLHWSSPAGPVLAAGITDSRGSLTTAFTVPRVATGPHSLFAVSGVNQANTTLTVTPTPTPSALGPGLLNQPAASPGAQILVHVPPGTFVGRTPVSVVGPGTRSYQLTAGPDGSLLSTIVVPSTGRSTSPVAAQGMLTDTASPARAVGQLTVVPTLVLLPASGSPGQAVNAAVLGFPGGDPITLHWVSPTRPALTPSASPTDGFGSGLITFTVPDNAFRGPTAVYAVGADAATATTVFTVS